MKKTRIAVFLLMIVLCIVALRQWNLPKNMVLRSFDKHRAQVQQIALDFDGKHLPEIDGTDDVTVWCGEHPAIEFYVGGSGLLPASMYYGFYYSPDDVPVAFQNADVPLVSDGDGWSWTEKGDNRGYTERIEANWFYYEASF